ncbi:MAG: NHL repeat-containing protein [Verrucomicrobiales bacterium]|nr:NHL repeat-containing protein [Verrucomicrobiales bacterium]
MKSHVIIVLLAGFLAGDWQTQGQLLYITDDVSDSIHRFSGGSDLGWFVAPQAASVDFSLAVDAEGNVYASFNGQIKKFGPSGADLGVFATPSAFPRGIAFDSNGNLYASLVGDTVHKFGPSGADLGTFASTGLNGCYAIAFDSSDNLYSANTGDHTVRKFGPTGTDLGIFASTGSDSSHNSFGLAFDRTGNLYASLAGAREIHKFGPSGADLGAFASFLSGDNLNSPRGLAFDDSGNLYVANHGNSTVEVLDPIGSHLDTLTSSSMIGPNALAISTVPEPAACGVVMGTAAATAVLWRRTNRRRNAVANRLSGGAR